MQVHYHNRTKLDQGKEQGAVYHDTLESLLQVSDFLSLHCPATADTQGLINDKTLALLPAGAILINTARGALVDESSLLKAIETGQLAAAGLDCFATEPGGNALFSQYKNIFMLPHIGSATRDTRDAMGYRALDNLDAFFSASDPGDRVA